MFKIYNKGDNFSILVETEILRIISNYGYKINNDNYNYVISIGGDGTFIDSINEEIDKIDNLKFIAINTGNLGFYTEPLKYFESIIDNIDNQFYDEYFLLEGNGSNFTYYAINEFQIISNTRTLIVEYHINNEYLQTQRGSGFIVSTPQGSTALAKSNGGAVIFPITKTFQITELSSINNNSYRSLNSSIILDSNSEFKVIIKNREFSYLNYDTKYGLNTSDEMVFKLSNKSVKVLHKQKNTFTKRLKYGFIK